MVLKTNLNFTSSNFKGQSLMYEIFMLCLWYVFMIDTIDIAGYADDNTPYSVGKNKYDLEKKLQKA